MDLAPIQSALRERDIDAWLFYDHHRRDPIAYRVLGLPETLFVTRRWYYLIPANGAPQGLVHRVESHHLDSLPGKKQAYSSWQEQQQSLRQLLSPYKTVAMQYSPNNIVPYIGLVDAGTVELIRSFGVQVITSADLVALFEATWTAEQIRSHFEAGTIVDAICAAAFQEIGRRVAQGGTHEFQIQQFIEEAFAREELTDENDPPIVAVNAHSGDPHYGPSSERSAPINKGDFVLIDMWAKKNRPDSVYYDITWTGVAGTPSDRHREIFQIVRDARNAGVHAVKLAIERGHRIAGWQIDQTTRDVIEDAGYGPYFVHRTGHSIGTSVHANGANIDNLETKDERTILPNSCFSIEPGIYLPEFGVRSEVNVLVRPGSAEVTGRIQQELVVIE
jgi:Xaa-Pro dipeptidase